MSVKCSIYSIGGGYKTQDYKDLLGKYITGNIVPGLPSSVQILNEIENIPRTEFEDFLPASWSKISIENIIQSSTNGNFILYGGYVPTGETPTSDSRGFIMILDQDMNPLKTIYKYSSGTLLRPIQKMIQIEDGTFVAIDSTIFAEPIGTTEIMTNEKRFIMLNNFSTLDYDNNYSVVLRKSYNLPSAYRNIFCLDIVKNPTSSHYLIAGKTLFNNGGTYYDGVRIIDLKINVGSSNEWSQKTSSSSSYWLYGGFYGEFDTDDVASYKIIITKNASPMELYTWDGTTLTKILEEINTFKPFVDGVSMKNQVSYIDYDNVYFVINNQRLGATVVPRYVGLYKYTYSTNTTEQIHLKEIGNYDWNGSREGIFIQALNGELYVNYFDNYDSNNKTANYNYQRLENDAWNPILITQDKKYVMEDTLTYTFNIYNLVSNIVLSQTPSTTYWYLQKIKEIYNNLNYNSTPYEKYNSLIPNTSALYSDNNLIFARNLYNSTYYRNTTTSTLEVPNTMLNGIDINNKSLYGKTNTLLSVDNQLINKNIYETLYINFINIINVIDQDTGNTYISSATNITTNINETNGDSTTMNNKKIHKIRINYEDGTDKTGMCGVYKYSDDFYEITSTIYVDKEISTIDIISNDETQIYITIDNLDLEVGNYYTLNQYLSIE